MYPTKMTFNDAQNIIEEMKVLEDIIKNGVTCTRSGGQADYFISNRSVINAINDAAKGQARIEMEKLKEKMSEFIGSK